MRKKTDQKTIRMRALLVFVITFLIVLGASVLLNQNQERGERLKAIYTAESTVSRVESQLNRYLAKSDLIKKMIESGMDVESNLFDTLSEFMQDERHVIEAHEIAKDGIINLIYPMEGNEASMGLNMFEHPERKQEARLAKESGDYTIAGPFELVQGGTGVLLFDPIYRADAQGEKQFWGFSILVLNWERFLEEMELDKLEDAGYHYEIWKKNASGGEKNIIAQCKDDEKIRRNTLSVACEVPNDVWYFDIVPVNGWVSLEQAVSGIVVAFILALLLMLGYWQFEEQRRKDLLHAEKLEKMAEEARSANEAKTRFLFNMSHDIRTPMNAIIGFSNFLKQHVDDREKTLEYIDKIQTSSSFLLSLINDVLEMARIESGKAMLKMESGCLSDLVNSLNAVFEPSIRTKNLKYSCNLNVTHEYLICDKTKLREIILNILGNAIKYTPDGGQVTVDITEENLAREGYARYRFVVKDTGIGMSEEYLPHIFEEFTRERTSTESKVFGAGLGLPIVKALIDLMGGTVEIESKVGKGSTFIVTLSFQLADQEQIRLLDQRKSEKTDLQASDWGEEKLREYPKIPEKAKKSEKTVENSESSQEACFQGKRVLLAEDNDLNAEIAETILEERGFVVERAADGELCVEELQKKPERYYDMILMDIQMPNMDGYTAAEVIRKLKDPRRLTPIVAMTANAFEEDRRKAFEAGMNAHIAKPINVNAMFETIREILSESADSADRGEGEKQDTESKSDQ
ncbi:ATP-binding protein [Brotaphodocola catenula]|uniref:Stage 0 sporulation protein A homolog n=1 Tax=Brotaphodocola catenula TaxID=2885361 RepID=A0AAE3AU97_9FIRM|nr:ATP-binding protein [Brotaphodocola catenula]MCC2165605.1 response regulator [Brotaphodocola catenula]